MALLGQSREAKATLRTVWSPLPGYRTLWRWQWLLPHNCQSFPLLSSQLLCLRQTKSFACSFLCIFSQASPLIKIIIIKKSSPKAQFFLPANFAAIPHPRESFGPSEAPGPLLQRAESLSLQLRTFFVCLFFYSICEPVFLSGVWGSLEALRSWVQVVTSLCTSCVTVGKSLSLSEPQFPHQIIVYIHVSPMCCFSSSSEQPWFSGRKGSISRKELVGCKREWGPGRVPTLLP